ncbi:hypothetical protein [Streptomyces sp. NPDC046805]|uniref:hypothetical protein n=1 Tax=Streptomyces sp. NPDC046805 TaxID=3155134 RepID=UPI0033E3A1C4
MGFCIARRAAMAAASVAVAAVGLLAAGGSASAATLPAGDRDTVASQSVRLSGAHDEGWNDARVRYGLHVHGSHDWDRDGGRRQWVLGQVDWTQGHHRGGYWGRDDDGRHRWVLDQLRCVHDRDGRHHRITVTVHEERSHHWDGRSPYGEDGRWVRD